MQELKELISSYQTLRESGRGPAICNTIIETARQCNLDKDIKLPEGDAKDLDLPQRDGVVGQAYSRYPMHHPFSLKKSKIECISSSMVVHVSAMQACSQSEAPALDQA